MIDPDVHYDLSDCDAFLSRILEDGDLGADVSQELVGSHSYKKVNLFTYFREGHLQMKVRFPKAGSVFLKTAIPDGVAACIYTSRSPVSDNFSSILCRIRLRIPMDSNR